MGLAVAFAGLSGLALVRIWATVHHRLPGKVILAAAVLLSALALFLAVRFSLAKRLLPAPSWKTALLGGAALLLGAVLDTSYAMYDFSGMLVSALPFRLLCHLGSGIVLAAIVLALWRAITEFGRYHASCGKMMLGLALAVNVLTALYAARSATVYYWDITTYWDSSIMLKEMPLGLAQLRLVLESVITQEYNYLLALPISLVMRVLGTSRYVYLFSIVNLYILPCLYGLCLLGRRVKGGGVLLTLFVPMLLYTALDGFADVAAAGAGIWTFLIYTDTDRPPRARGLLSGALLVLTFLLRRYFFFFAVSFGVAALIALVLRKGDWKAFLSLFGSAAVCSLFFAQSFLVQQVLRANYSDTYSAYSQGLQVDVNMFSRYFGLLPLLAGVLAGLALLLRRKERRYGALLSLTQAVLCFALFTRVQSHGLQHLLLYLPALCWLVISAAEAWSGKAVTVCAWALAVSVAVSAYLPGRQVSPLPYFTYQPEQREDIAQLIALRTYVDGLSLEEPKTAAIVASSFQFNQSIYANTLRSMNIPEPDAPKTKIIYMADVDKRDAFSWNILNADYLVVGDPVQSHLGEENQQIITSFAHAVLDHTGVGTAYAPTGTEFSLRYGIKVRIYERVRAITPEECQAISDALVARYPDYAQLYQVPDAFRLAP